MIDLHTHTYESDGTLSPAELLTAARDMGLEALAICDHDTFAGYDQALPLARDARFDLVCGIELNSRFFFADNAGPRSVHLLGYFLRQAPTAAFRAWLSETLTSRRERNRRLVQKLQSLGIDIELSEVEALGRTLTGRPHFARVLVRKGYAANSEEAFRKYLGETAAGFVERQSPDPATAIGQIVDAGGVPVVAHPIRLGFRSADREEAAIAQLCDAGLRGIEVYHSDQTPSDTERYAALAAKYGLMMTGGTDFHGAAKPSVALGTGIDGNVHVPHSVLDEMRNATS